MKTQKIIDKYCRLYRVAIPEINCTETHYFVTISPDGASVLYLHKASELLGRIVCSAMKRGMVLYVHNGWVKPLTWEMWKQTWAKLFAPKPRQSKASVPDKTRPYRSEIFETMQPKRPAKKPQKHGFERTYNANTSMNLLSHPLSGMCVERI